ncbi:Glu-tRNA(Gln) amidotransferase subunit GatE, partial [Candidatus Micrarchaeota archaeon]|nr:Glu-tRNA(Gln) amidotransferase subunit GatE [Candidatus Micrarchaeota archaeon]
MKIGIEIHQRLQTHKLFCSCPSDTDEDARPDSLITRKLHPVYSELGEIDEASLKEKQKDLTFEYQVFEKNNCLVEIDEEPPHSLNEDALQIVLGVSLHLNSKPVDEVHVMRKMVIDGSNTSGFQRTAVVSLGGKVKTSRGDVRINAVALEEESAGIISKSKEKAVYRLDRLGIPLIEIATEPDIKDGAHLLETAERIGMILRSTGRVMRGIGTIRQDVNISIEGGSRVEIKGAQNLKLLPLFVENEVKRQLSLIKIKEELNRRFKNKIKIDPDLKDLTSVFASTKSKLISSGIKNGESVLGLRLPNFKGVLGKETQKGRRYGTELSDYAKNAGVKGIIHSDEDISKYKISTDEEAEARKKLKVGENDAFVLVVAFKSKAEKALFNVVERAEMTDVPKETRRANPDGTSAYLRPLPGRARMYPETDIPPVRITSALLKSAEESSGEGLEKKREK